MNEKLRNARHDRRWSLDEAADKVKVSRTTYVRWEQGTQRPHGSSLNMVCEAFKMTPEQLGFRSFATVAVNKLQLAPLQTSEPVSGAASVNVLNFGVLALLLAQQQNGWTLNELEEEVMQEIKRQNTSTGPKITRKQMLSFLIGMPLGVAGLFQSDNNLDTSLTEEMLPIYSTAIPACWRSYFTDGNPAEIGKVLPSYVSQLIPLAQKSSKSQKLAAGLVSQIYQLSSMLVLQKEDFRTSLEHCNDAFLYAKIADDPNLQAASLIRKVNTLYYRKRFSQISQTLQEVGQYVNLVSPLLQGRIYSELASDVALKKQEQEALRYMGLARDLFPDQPEDDPGFLYTHTTHYILQLNEALAYRDLDQPKNAWIAIEKAEAYVPDTLSTRRIELVTHQAMIATILGDLEMSCSKLESAIHACQAINSDLWLSDARDIYEKMVLKWPREQKVKRLDMLFHT
ncbi:helix-turn-helix domain-containing protein [Dictyobacter formicarum]|uniref:HTH cro/C1-type domain-containing protein n=1 Tax=Dictyobacter formicarum TaxID=2778368 RepID=A0ABQ3VP63_9CHLR|nr:helix-turn-helix transcriptional regulator [Dictyobacter formicarum]GHO88032.1 hypothetical protein KSZ_60380 [Dictyobacter formicarum]